MKKSHFRRKILSYRHGVIFTNAFNTKNSFELDLDPFKKSQS